MKKIMTIVGTRPELIKLCLTIKELDRHFNHCLVHTGQNFDYELNEVFFKDLNIRKPDHFLEAAGATAMETIANVLVKVDRLLDKEKPDGLLIYGDTNSCLSAIAAKRKKIPIFHMEAGNRCFDARVPEEINRKIVDHLSDINMPLTEHGRDHLIREGLPPQNVLKTGSCLTEIVSHFRPQIEKSTILKKLGLKKKAFFVVSAHREENIDQPPKLKLLIGSLNALAKEFKMPVLFSVHPRTAKQLDKIKGLKLDKNIRLSKPLGFHDYNNLQLNAKGVISDSGTLSEESAILGFPGVHIRDAYERPEGMEAGVLLLSSLLPVDFLQAVRIAVDYDRRGKFSSNPVPDYSIDQVSKTVVKIIASHLEYIQRTVWTKI